MRYNAKVPIWDLWDYVSNTNCLERDCTTQYIIKRDGKRWVADTICDPECTGSATIEQMQQQISDLEQRVTALWG